MFFDEFSLLAFVLELSSLFSNHFQSIVDLLFAIHAELVDFDPIDDVKAENSTCEEEREIQYSNNNQLMTFATRRR